MQLQFAYMLKQLLPLTLHHASESADVELETGVKTSEGSHNIDILLRGKTGTVESLIAIEMKCYKNVASSGGNRGAQNIFMKDVYEDLHVLERYVSEDKASGGVALVMTDREHFVNPSKKQGDCWAYDISDNTVFPGGKIVMPIAGKPVQINLLKSYTFTWAKFGGFWFMELEGANV